MAVFPYAKIREANNAQVPRALTAPPVEDASVLVRWDPKGHPDQLDQAGVLIGPDDGGFPNILKHWRGMRFYGFGEVAVRPILTGPQALPITVVRVSISENYEDTRTLMFPRGYTGYEAAALVTLIWGQLDAVEFLFDLVGKLEEK